MTDETDIGRKRRTAAEVEQLVHEFESSGLSRSQFCERQGLALITLARYLKRVHNDRAAMAGQGLVAVELRGGEASADRSGAGGLTVVLAGGRRIEVSVRFDTPTLQRLVQALEQ
jgi:hypothetical protein